MGRSELETYINLLFFEKTNGRESDSFQKAQEYISNDSDHSLLDVRFNYGIARQLLDDNVPQELSEDLSIAQRIAPILVIGLNGNPRQCKRFLNKLMMRIEMAKVKKVDLKQRVLAKLMLLEYFSPQFFKQLAELQANQQGHPKEISIAERHLNPQKITKTDDDSSEESSNSEGGESKGKKVSRKLKNAAADPAEKIEPTVLTWVSDGWMKEWLKSEPSLVNEDLQSYFFFSRDTLQGVINTALQRMTPQAQDMLSGLFHSSEAVRNNTLRKVGELSPGDVAAVFQTLAERVKEEEDLGDESSAFNRLYDLVSNRPELFNQFLAFITELPESVLPFTIVPRLANLGGKQETREPVRDLLQKWEDSTNLSLKSAATQRLKSF